MGETDGYNPERREFVSNLGTLIASGLMTGITSIGIERYGTANYESEGRQLDPQKKAELDAIIDESLQDFAKVEANLREMSFELKKAGATEDQIAESRQRYVEYITDRYRAKLLEIAGKIERPQ